jgi:hypothetical protein
MMENKMEQRERIIFWLIVMQPVIDLITSLSNQFNILTVGALSRTVIMGILVVYFASHFIRRQRYMLWLFVASFAVILITFLVNLLYKENFYMFQELNFALKTGYYLTMIFLAILLVEHNKCRKATLYQATKFVSLIVGISYWLAIATHSSIQSYSYDSIGYAGWFFAANELSVIVIILLGLSISNLLSDHTPTAWLALLLIVSMLPMIGTKTAFFGGIFILGISVVAWLLRYRFRIWRHKSMLYMLGIIVLLVCLVPFSPITSNTEQITTQSTQHTKVNTAPVTENGDSALMRKLLSSRNVYFQHTKADYLAASGLRKAFGLGYAGDYEQAPKLIEMDFFDLFFSYGIIGTICLLAPLIYLAKQILAAIIPIRAESLTLFVTLGICFAIAFLAGHVIFAPSVMTYTAILCVTLGVGKYDNGEYYRTGI